MGGYCFNENEQDIKEDARPTRIKNHDKTLLDLKRRKRECNEYIKRLEQKIKETKIEAIKSAKSNKKKALTALKLKKMFESTLDKSLGVVQMIERTIIVLEETAFDAGIYEILKDGDKVIKELRSQANLENFQELYENINQYDELAEYIEKEVIGDKEYLDELKELEDKLVQANKKPSSFYTQEKRSPVPINNERPKKKKKLEEPEAIPS